MHNIKSITQKDRYGNMFSLEMFEDQGVPLMIMIPDMPNGFNGADTDNHPGKPKGTDTVPAWLTPGENVVNAEASRIPGNQEKIDQMNEQGREMQAAQGGPIPTYAATGTTVSQYEPYDVPNWFTPEILENLIEVESGNNNQAFNPKSGARGPAQIMSDTALDPGYNVQPISLEDRTDPVKARRFATQYIAGIQKENPDYTPAQVLQAYNAGPGRLAQSISGKGKPLAQETIDYPAKILGENFVPPKPASLKTQIQNKNRKFNIKAVTNNLKNVQEKFDEFEKKRQQNIARGRDEFKGINKNTYELYQSSAAKLQSELDELTRKDKAMSPVNTTDFVNTIIAETDTGEAPDQPTIDPNEVTKEGFNQEEKNPGFFKEALGLFTDVLGDMFPPKDIARMAINYIGSRALGYEHNGSLNYTMKQYATRAELQAKQEYELIKANAKNYTAASYADYIQSRDPDDLIPVDLSRVTAMAGKIYHTQLGTLRLVKKADGNQYVTIPIGTGKNKKSVDLRLDDPRVAPYLEDYNEDIHDSAKVKKAFFETAKQGIIDINAMIDEDDPEIPRSEAGNISSEMLMLFQRDRKRYGGISSENQYEIIRNLELAQQQYYRDYKLYLEDERDTKPQSIASYYNTNMLVIDTDNIINYNDTVGTDSKNIQKVINQVNELAVKSFPDDKKAAAMYYKNAWAGYKNIWDKYTQLAEQKRLDEFNLRPNFINAGDNKQFNDFFNFIDKVQNKNKDALAIVSRLR